ncbi:transposase [Pseudoduganella namucuonensis]|uniref:Mutator family transposase n=1 Tax=Pseudoduganella namucuonensis TaxID=1035707 RepID=A0A1I7L7V8_9BURK|nr:transposase [Pseudoduganella namucuonensis]SFV05725.1 Transposase, Mutator family [Pseudoduganella namucuonensis]
MGVICELGRAAVPARSSADGLVDQLLEEARLHSAAALLSRSGMTVRLMKALAECMLGAELKQHLLRQAVRESAQCGNYRNGSTPKTVATSAGRVELAVPRARHSTFVPQLVPRYRRSIPGFDHDIIVLYGRGVPLHELRARLRGLYGEQAWSELGGTLSAEVALHVGGWQARRLESAHELLYFGVLYARRHPADGTPEGTANRPLLFALGLRADGGKDVLGLWAGTAGQPFPWRDVLRELRERGLGEPRTIAGDGAPGLREAAAQAYPAARFAP